MHYNKIALQLKSAVNSFICTSLVVITLLETYPCQDHISGGNCAIDIVLILKRLFHFLNQRRRRRPIAAESNASGSWTRLRRGLSPGYQQSTTVVVQQESIHVHHPTILLLANIMTVDIVIGRHDNDDGQTQTELLGLP